MSFRSTFHLIMRMFKTHSTSLDYLHLINGSCALTDGIAGGPCEWKPKLTVINFNDVSNYHHLEIRGRREIYTVHFAEDCKFPPPHDREIIVEKSIPLYPFSFGKSQETVTFAIKGTSFEVVICNF
ncbi:unnamed protein product [Hymenolepis diminuta]|uniref:DUF5727 domain-containing protein n=1 Tax=Hymenolepis diminuta TaxID=6216 RepID=A0A564YF84_HYMDI|nr:unnamed protein product [Hymenolepis diminuta]